MFQSKALGFLLIALGLVGLVFAQEAARPAFTIYDDKLADGWDCSWSWDCRFDLSSKSYKHQGKCAISVTYTGGRGGLAFASIEGIDSRVFKSLRFYINGGEIGGQRLRVGIEDNLEGKVTGQVTLNNSKYIQNGKIISNEWKLVNIPLADLNAVKIRIHKITIMDNTGSTPPTFYVDYVVLTP